MRPRLAVLMSALSVLVAVVSPGLANAAPRHNHGLTIAAVPTHIITGDPVLIYGRLQGPDSGGQTVVLFHRVNPSPVFTQIGVTTTNANGYYEFTRAEDVVLTNRSWFVRAPSLPGNIHSRTVRERVAAAVSIGAFTQTGAATVTGDTTHPIVFAGHVDPVVVHVGEQVLLQQQEGISADDWHTIDRGVIGAGSDYSISHRFAIAGERDLRVLFRGDVRNTEAVSDTLTVTIQQTQNPTFTINTSAPVIDDHGSATISGVLYMPASTTTSPVPDPNVSITLMARQPGGTFQAIDHGTTGADGSYSFAVSPDVNTAYVVATTYAPPAIRHSTALFEAVRDLVTLTPSATSVTVGQLVTFTGLVTPDKAGDQVYLQLLGKDGDFHNVGLAFVSSTSAYQFRWRFGTPGTYELRTLISGDDVNASGHSSAVTESVSLPPVAALPTAP
ncbi:MAG: hypothetical protein ABSG43_28555 [Solirubrobacteraceae bacterium]